MKDLLDIQKYLRKEAVFTSRVPTVQQTIDSIQSGKDNSEIGSGEALLGWIDRRSIAGNHRLRNLSAITRNSAGFSSLG